MADSVTVGASRAAQMCQVIKRPCACRRSPLIPSRREQGRIRLLGGQHKVATGLGTETHGFVLGW